MLQKAYDGFSSFGSWPGDAICTTVMALGFWFAYWTTICTRTLQQFRWQSAQNVILNVIKKMIFDTEPSNWTELQNYVGQMFTECGFHTEVSKVVNLVRGQKEIDVYTQDNRSEYKPIILVECKFWSKPVSQETVHAFRTVVADFGANLGFIVSRNGFQAGSYDAAKSSNVRLVTLKELESEYYSKWKQGLTERYMPFADRLFPYWDYPGKMPMDGGTIDWDTQQLVYSAYQPICHLGPTDQMKEGFKRHYPIVLPVLNEKLEIVGEETISTDRQYFDFVEKNKEKALRHFKILYRENH